MHARICTGHLCDWDNKKGARLQGWLCLSSWATGKRTSLSFFCLRTWFLLLPYIRISSKYWKYYLGNHNNDQNSIPFITIFVLFLPYCRPWVGWLSCSQFLWCWSLASTGRGLYFIFIYAPLSTGWRRPRPRENLDLRSAPSSPQRMSGGRGFQHFNRSQQMLRMIYDCHKLQSLWSGVMSYMWFPWKCCGPNLGCFKR